MKWIFTILLSVLLINVIFAKPIDEQTALKVAEKFKLSNTGNNVKSNVLKVPNFKCVSKVKDASVPLNTSTYYFVFSSGENDFTIVSGDDSTLPILGYSTESNFDPNNIPPNVAKWLEGYKNEIRYIIQNNIQPTTYISEQWRNLKSDEVVNEFSETEASVNPLIQTKWNQSPYYNALCPGSSVTGCVATAMSQIMKYWNSPATGTGFHSYNHQNYGTLSANFGNTTYQWTSMPNVLSTSNSAVATLMYQVGVSVDMDYSPEGSSAYVISAQSETQNCAEYALKTYFGYKKTLQGIERANFNQTQWLNLLKTEFNANRPVLFAGFGSGGHCFVADGYDGNNYIHFNWGWGGQCDGFFQINALNPGGDNFSAGQQAIIGIEPTTNSNPTSFSLYSSISVNPNPINYGQSLTVNADIINNGGTTFYGEIAAVLFDENYNFVEYIQTLTENGGLPPNFHYTNGNNFVSSGLNASQGKYYIGIYLKPIDGNWIQVGNGSYQNLIPISIFSSNNIKMYSPIIVTPSTIIQNQAAKIKLDVSNSGTAFNGNISVDLHNLDGTWVQNIDEITGLSMPANSHFTNGLTFTSSGQYVNSGSYLIAVWAQENGGEWKLVEATNNYFNPVKITISQAPFQPDAYEPNNTQPNACNLSPVFMGNAATLLTEGTNIDIGTDIDYYKVILPSGYNYKISARLHDAYNSGNGNNYTVDGLFSYSIDENNWSDNYDDVMPGNIILNSEGTVYFKVMPFFIGQKGTYFLELNLVRTSTTDIFENRFEEFIQVYPIPAKDFIKIDLNKFSGEVNQINLIDLQGEKVSLMYQLTGLSTLNLPLNNLSNGIYFIQFQTNHGIITKKIIIAE